MTDTIVEETDVLEPSRRGRWTRLSIVGILLVVAVFAWVFSGRFGQNPRLVDSPLVGKPLPELSLDYLEAEGSLNFSDLRDQVLVINVWASWCVPCRVEHPALTMASEVYEDRGVHFIGILYQDRPAAAIAFLDELGRGANYSYVVDPDSRATIELGVFGVPETFFVDADGIVVGRIQGELSPTVLVQAIEDVLAGREPRL